MSDLSDAVQDIHIVSTYMKKKLPFVLLRFLGNMERPESPDVEVPHPRRWSVEFALEVDWALDVIARAFHDQGMYYKVGYSDPP